MKFKKNGNDLTAVFLCSNQKIAIIPYLGRQLECGQTLNTKYSEIPASVGSMAQPPLPITLNLPAPWLPSFHLVGQKGKHSFSPSREGCA